MLTLNLKFKHSIAKVISQCHNIVAYIHRSAQAKETLHTFQRDAKVKVVGVIQAVQTRWNSTYSMLSRLKEIKTQLIETL